MFYEIMILTGWSLHAFFIQERWWALAIGSPVLVFGRMDGQFGRGYWPKWRHCPRWVEILDRPSSLWGRGTGRSLTCRSYRKGRLLWQHLEPCRWP